MKLLLADDHTLFRDALVLYIERAEPGSTVTLAKDLYKAIDALDEDPEQDLILLDLRMPGMKGLQGLQKIRNLHPKTPVALMSGVAEPNDVADAMKMGAVGYFPKTLSGKALLKAIQQVISGEKFMPKDDDTKMVMPSYYADKNDDKSAAQYTGMSEDQMEMANDEVLSLTPREREVLSFLARGASNKEIANGLGLQVVTVKLHVRGVCKKLNAQNRTQAALKARELGISAR